MTAYRTRTYADFQNILFSSFWIQSIILGHPLRLEKYHRCDLPAVEACHFDAAVLWNPKEYLLLGHLHIILLCNFLNSPRLKCITCSCRWVLDSVIEKQKTSNERIVIELDQVIVSGGAEVKSTLQAFIRGWLQQGTD
jgi:hypothetical protein